MRTLTTILVTAAAVLSTTAPAQTKRHQDTKPIKVFAVQHRHYNGPELGYMTSFHFALPAGLQKKQAISFDRGIDSDDGVPPFLPTPEGQAIIKRLKPLLPAGTEIEVETYSITITLENQADVPKAENTVLAAMETRLGRKFAVERSVSIIKSTARIRASNIDINDKLPEIPTPGNLPLQKRPYMTTYQLEPDRSQANVLYDQAPSQKAVKFMTKVFQLPGITAIIYEHGTLSIFFDLAFDQDQIDTNIRALNKKG